MERLPTGREKLSNGEALFKLGSDIAKCSPRVYLEGLKRYPLGTLGLTGLVGSGIVMAAEASNGQLIEALPLTTGIISFFSTMGELCFFTFGSLRQLEKLGELGQTGNTELGPIPGSATFIKEILQASRDNISSGTKYLTQKWDEYRTIR